MTDGATALGGRTILLVEDEVMLLFLVEEMLIELGCTVVWQARNVEEALSVLRDRRPDAAVLDINLMGQMVYPVAERLESDRVPFVFATGYGLRGVPDRWRRRPILQKPFAAMSLESALNAALQDGVDAPQT